jgi:hypothetical protein
VEGRGRKRSGQESVAGVGVAVRWKEGEERGRRWVQ